MNRPGAARSFSIVLAVLLPCSAVHADEENAIRSSVAPVGDVDDDGVPDFALAQRGPGPKRWSFSSEYKTKLVLVRIVSGRDGTLIRTLHRPKECVDFGRALADVGDIDGDEARDLAVAGGERVWVFSGADGHIVHELGKKHGSRGFGRSLAGGGDVDGDDVPDIVVFRNRWAGVEALLLLYSGGSGNLIRAFGCNATPQRPELAELYASVSGPELTGAVAIVPDRTGDGRAELALTVGRVPPAELAESSDTLLVIDATDASLLQKSSLSGSQPSVPWVIQPLGDLDGDSMDEVAVSIIHKYVLVYASSKGEELRRHSFVHGRLNAAGTSLDAMEDVNGDGIPDYVVGANEDSLGCDPGFATVYSGKNGEALRSLSFPSEGNCGVGVDVCTLGDANGDGVDDVVVHMPRLREARVLSGADFSVLMLVDTTELAAEGRQNR